MSAELSKSVPKHIFIHKVVFCFCFVRGGGGQREQGGVSTQQPLLFLSTPRACACAPLQVETTREMREGWGWRWLRAFLFFPRVRACFSGGGGVRIISKTFNLYDPLKNTIKTSSQKLRQRNNLTTFVTFIIMNLCLLSLMRNT
jgi:hypothetical protein